MNYDELQNLFPDKAFLTDRKTRPLDQREVEYLLGQAMKELPKLNPAVARDVALFAKKTRDAKSSFERNIVKINYLRTHHKPILEELFLLLNKRFPATPTASIRATKFFDMPVSNIEPLPGSFKRPDDKKY